MKGGLWIFSANSPSLRQLNSWQTEKAFGKWQCPAEWREQLVQICEGTERSFSMAGTAPLCLGAASFACPGHALRALPRDLLLFYQNSFLFFFLSCCGFVNHPLPSFHGTEWGCTTHPTLADGLWWWWSNRTRSEGFNTAHMSCVDHHSKNKTNSPLTEFERISWCHCALQFAFKASQFKEFCGQAFTYVVLLF